jgi:ribosomal protein L32
MRAITDEFTKYKLLSKCPSCGNQHIINVLKAISSWKCFDGQGRAVSMLTPIWRLPSGSHVVCQRCGYSIQIFAADKPQPSPAVITLTETHRSEELTGRDERLIDNSSGPSDLNRKLMLAREWSRQYQVERERSTMSRNSMGLTGQDIIRVSAETERALKERYSITDTSRETYTEEVEVSVPAGARVRITIEWKNLWQHGVLNVSLEGKTVTHEYKVAAGVTFDLKQDKF